MILAIVDVHNEEILHKCRGFVVGKAYGKDYDVFANSTESETEGQLLERFERWIRGSITKSKADPGRLDIVFVNRSVAFDLFCCLVQEQVVAQEEYNLWFADEAEGRIGSDGILNGTAKPFRASMGVTWRLLGLDPPGTERCYR